MSKFNKCVLAGAISLVFSGAALAASTIVTTNGSFAHEVTKSSASGDPTAQAAAVSLNVQAPDILIGRSSVTGQVTVSGTINGATMASAPVVTFPAPGAGTAASLQGSVTAGTNSFQFVVLPPDVAAGGFAQGNIFTITALDLKDATALSTLGGQVTVTIEVKDTTTGTLLSSATVKPVLTSVQGSATVNTGAAPTTIDVMSPSLKTKFLTNPLFTTLGTVAVSQANVGTVASPALASVLGTGAAGNTSAADEFQFDAANDELDLTLTVPSADAFTAFYARKTACTGVVAPATDVVFTQVGTTNEYTASADIDVATGVTYNICAVVDGTTKIDAQTIGLKSQIDLGGALTIDPPAVTTEAFHVLKYNGSVAKVDHFNPASNTDQVSYLRIINPSTSDGLVHIEGVCDDGTAQASVNLTLNAGNAVLLTAADLKNGAKGLSAGLAQCSTGKSRLTVTGEFAGMRVQNFLRNVTTAGQVNTNVNTNDLNTQGQ